jgi:hypothetical protein
MQNTRSPAKGYIMAALLGAVGGALIVVLAAKVFPQMMSGMMGKMMEQMRQSGCSPAEM